MFLFHAFSQLEKAPKYIWFHFINLEMSLFFSYLHKEQSEAACQTNQCMIRLALTTNVGSFPMILVYCGHLAVAVTCITQHQFSLTFQSLALAVVLPYQLLVYLLGYGPHAKLINFFL